MSESKSKSPLSFEESMAALNTIVENMERGDLPLEEALAQFEEGIKLVRAGQEHLQKAEQKVKILMQDSQSLADFDHDQEQAAE